MNVENAVNRAIGERGRDAIARAIGGKDPSVISGITGNRQGILLRDLGAFLEACGLRVVTEESVLVDPEELRALRVLARMNIERSEA